jgi:hypothetical protein
MTLRLRLELAPLHLAILRSAAWLVPGAQRAEWLAEWRAELWYVRRDPTLFCLGAVRDALWLRRNTPRQNAGHPFSLESPVRCLLFLGILAAASAFFAFRLPVSRDMLLPSPYHDGSNLVMISADEHYYAELPTVPIERYLSLENRKPDEFRGFAFYRPMQMRVRTAARESAELAIALVSANLFTVLEIPISTDAPSQSGQQSRLPLILSHAAWRKYFDADPHIVGRRLEVAGQPAVVAGVIPASSWGFPGRMDAWLLQDQPRLAEMPPNTEGFVLGRIRKSAARFRADPQWRLDVPNERGGYDHFACSSSLAKGPFMLAGFVMFLVSLLVLAATTPLALGEYPTNRYSPPGAMKRFRWIFFAVKIAFLLVTVCCGSLDLASITSLSILPYGLLVGLILALRWALIDQRQRCPVCLRLLTNPTRIGGPSQTFLEWYGTELMCAQGHGLLYVPEIPTSCYSTQRWQYLDPSWSGLFS